MSNTQFTDAARVPAILLAGGGSKRLGEPKQLLRLPEFCGETLLERAIRLANESGADPVLVVLGAHAEEIQSQIVLKNCTILLNPGWAEGMASSLRVGIHAAKHACRSASGALLMVCDQPGLSAEHLKTLLTLHRADPNCSTVSRYAGRRGVPAVVSRSHFPALLAMQGDQGARAIWMQADISIKDVPFPDGAWDIDSPEDLHQHAWERCAVHNAGSS